MYIFFKEEEEETDAVKSIFSKFDQDKTISSLEVVEEICKIRPKYANEKAGTFPFTKIKTNKEIAQLISKTSSEWKKEIHSLYTKEKVPQLTGRLTIFGLTLIDKKLAEILMQNKFLPTLIDEIRGRPYESLLNEDKKQLWKQLSKQLSVLSNIKEKTLGYFIQNYKDDPAKDDLFGRKPLAVVLADIINQLYYDKSKEDVKDKEESFVINIHGPWGAGKSTLLGYIKDELTNEAKKKTNIQAKNVSHQWIIVDFNAWQNQRTQIPLWWSIMDSVYRESIRNLQSFSKIKIRIFERFWRLHTGHAYIFWILAIVLAVIGILLFNYHSNNNPEDPIKPEALIAVVGSIISIAGGIRSSLSLGSSNSAKTFLETNSEPTKKIQDHFEKLIKKIQETHKPIAILIDDLDRCDKEYVIKFLESIHTLFKKANLIYIIAADQRWIYSCYEKNYLDFKENFDVPGRQLGYLFMDKIFQLTVPLPRLSSEDKEKYLKYLLFNKQIEEDKNLDQQISKIIEEHNNDPGALIEYVNKGLEKKDIEKKLRDELVKNLQTKKMQEHTEHFLMQFAHFLDPNPRSMKLFMNIFNIVRAVDILSSTKIDQRKLALWTILNIRWPDLTKFLAKYPKTIEHFGKNEEEINDKNIQNHLKSLFNNKDVLDVINGRDINGREIGVKIDEDTLKNIIFW
jgi:hypothetical protein